MREAFGLAELDGIWNLSLRFIATLSSFGIHIIFAFFYFQPLWPLNAILDQIFLFLDMSVRGDMLILGFLWILDFMCFCFSIQFASIGHGRGV